MMVLGAGAFGRWFGHEGGVFPNNAASLSLCFFFFLKKSFNFVLEYTH